MRLLEGAELPQLLGDVGVERAGRRFSETFAAERRGVTTEGKRFAREGRAVYVRLEEEDVLRGRVVEVSLE